jgi:hypothetical protein
MGPVTNRSLLEYASTEAFVLLFLTGGVEQTDLNRSTVKSVFHLDYDPDVAEGAIVPESVTEILPTTISCKNFAMNLDDEGELHSPGVSKFGPGTGSFRCDNMTMVWKRYEPDPNSTAVDPVLQIVALDREDGPATVVFENMVIHHNHGVQVGFEFETMKASWYRRGNLYRASGPCSITLMNTKARIDHRGTWVYHPINSIMTWNHPGDGSNITEAKAAEVIRTEGIAWNRFAPGKSVFANAMEELVFYSTV